MAGNVRVCCKKGHLTVLRRRGTHWTVAGCVIFEKVWQTQSKAGLDSLQRPLLPLTGARPPGYLEHLDFVEGP
jgi:hypothetical protein